MWPYWMMFLMPLWAVLHPERAKAIRTPWLWFVVGSIFALLIGLRYQVGADWFNYLPIFQDTGSLDFNDALFHGDPGYALLNWSVFAMGGSIFWVNLPCAVVLMVGTVVFCRRQPNSWLAFLAAVPYMLVVVGDGYTRQSVALGFALLGLAALGEGRVRSFVIWIALGALFHKTAVLLMPIAALAASRNRWLTMGLVLVAAVLAYFVLLRSSADDLWTNYVQADMQSEGGAIRVAMNSVPALILFANRRKLVPNEQERKLWLLVAILALACIPLVALASTAVDRMALYLIPLQLFVFARLPRLARTTEARTMIVVGIVGYYAAVQFVWLNFATHAQYWVPYQFMPLWN